MKIGILDWSYKNIRGVNNLSITVEKESNHPHKVSMIMMPNGYGKTTTQILLRAIFDGTATEWDYEKVRGFKPSNTTETMGEFKVSLIIDGHIYIVVLRLDYYEGKAEYKTSRVGDQGGLENGRKLPNALKSAFTPEFVKRFIFDGELAKEIIGRESNEAERTIRYLYQLNRLDEIQSRIDVIVKEKQKNAEKTSAKTETGLTRLRNELLTIEQVRGKLIKNKYKLQNDLKNNENRLNDVTKEIYEHIKSDNSLREQAEQLERDRDDIESKISNKSQSILNDMRNPFLLSKSIADELSSLSTKMQVLKLPRTMSRQFFEELAENDICVCGRKIGEKEKTQILEKSCEFLAEDQIGVINAIKTSIRGRSYNHDLRNDCKDLKALLVRRYEIKSDWDRLQVQRSDAGDFEFQELETEKNELVEQIQIIKDKLKILTTNDRFEKEGLTYQDNISICNEELEKIKEKIDEALGTVMLTYKANKLKRYLQEIASATISKLKDRIKDETNEKLSEIIKAESIKVEEIKGYLKLEGKTGASEGQSLAIAYSFLGSMFETSSHNLPFVVDSPAGSLDLSVRRQVSKIIPHLFDQLIIFITSGEREAFTDYFYSLGDEVQFLTITKDGVKTDCIEGEETFKRFQEEEDVLPRKI